MTTPQHVARIVGLIVLVAWTFTSPGAAWVYEDPVWLQPSGPPSFRLRALTYLSWSFQQWLWPGPAGAHLVNLGLHGIMGVLAWQWARRLRLSPDGAYIMSALVLVHPLTAETVAYAAQRGELLAAIGVMGACVLAAGSWWRWPMALGIVFAVGLGVLGKETAIIALALVPLTMWATAYA